MQFNYIAKKTSGEETSGTMEASNQIELSHRLRAMGFIPIFIEKKSEGKFNFSSFGIVSSADKIMFAKNLSVMIAAGLPLTRALETLGRQAKNLKMKNSIIALMDNAKKGEALSDSMKKFPRIFSKLFVAMVKTGEESGKLSESLKLAGQQIENDYVLSKRVKSAMIYPTIILSAMVLIGIFMFIYVVPTLVSTFKELKMELPLSTKVIVMLSDILTKHLILFILIFFAVIFSVFWFFKTEKGKIILSNVLLAAPIVSPVVKKINSARTSRTLASLISSGVNIVEALNITKDVLQNSRYKKVLAEAAESVQKGLPISNSFKNSSKIYPLLLSEMMAVGEETGKISEMMEKIAIFYEEEVAEATKNMSTVVEPILMIFIGAAVGFFALSMIKPMYSMMNGI